MSVVETAAEDAFVGLGRAAESRDRKAARMRMIALGSLAITQASWLGALGYTAYRLI